MNPISRDNIAKKLDRGLAEGAFRHLSIQFFSSEQLKHLLKVLRMLLSVLTENRNVIQINQYKVQMAKDPVSR